MYFLCWAAEYLSTFFFNWIDFKYAIYVSAPAIIIHELGHKFVAMAYGYTATFEMFSLGLAIGVVLKLIGSP